MNKVSEILGKCKESVSQIIQEYDRVSEEEAKKVWKSLGFESSEDWESQSDRDFNKSLEEHPERPQFIYDEIIRRRDEIRNQFGDAMEQAVEPCERAVESQFHKFHSQCNRELLEYLGTGGDISDIFFLPNQAGDKEGGHYIVRDEEEEKRLIGYFASKDYFIGEKERRDPIQQRFGGVDTYHYWVPEAPLCERFMCGPTRSKNNINLYQFMPTEYRIIEAWHWAPLKSGKQLRSTLNELTGLDTELANRRYHPWNATQSKEVIREHVQMWLPFLERFTEVDVNSVRALLESGDIRGVTGLICPKKIRRR